MSIIKKYFISFLFATTLLATNSAYALPDENSMESACIKATLEALRTYTLKTTIPKEVKSPLPPTDNTLTAQWKNISTTELFEIFIDWMINNTLQSQFGKNLCSGKGAGRINYHKIISIVLTEAAKLAATSSELPTDALIKKYTTNLVRKLLEKNFALNTDPKLKHQNLLQNLVGTVAITAASLTPEFYKDLEAGTVDLNEFKNLGGKYRSIQSGAESFIIDRAAIQADAIAGKTIQFKNGCDKYNAKAVASVLVAALKPYIKYGVNAAAQELENPAMPKVKTEAL